MQPDAPPPEDDAEALRRRLVRAEVRLGLRLDPRAAPAGEGMFHLSRWEVYAALILLGAALAARFG